MSILFVAAESFELKPFAAYLTGCRSLNWPLDYAEEGVLDGQRAILVANGAGPKLASQATEVALRAVMVAELSSSKLEAIVSVGICGALDPALRVNQVLVAGKVVAVDPQDSFDCQQPTIEGEAVTGVVLSLDRVAWTVEEKTALRAQGGDAVDMEAAGVAAKARQADVPFFCVKVVSDQADQPLPFDLNQMRTREGRFARGRIGSYAITHPNALPGLLRLKRRADDAAQTLGEFLVRCRIQPERAPEKHESTEV
jgi:adenosylhomocysteine nucleosidase